MDPWVVPTINLATAVLKNRSAITKMWDSIAGRLQRSGMSFAVIGEPGVGKTVLVDHLVGDAYVRDYQPPGQSSLIEKDSHKYQDHRYVFRVVPGQAVHRDRVSDLEKVLSGSKSVDGLIYVVANGLHETRSTLVEDLTVELEASDPGSVRRRRLDNELRGLEEALRLIRSSFRQHRKPSWLIVAVNKADLFSTAEDLETVKQLYIGRDSPFRLAIDEFRTKVGQDNFFWTCLPVCGWLENYTLGETTIETRLTPQQRDQMIINMLDTVDRVCRAAQ